MILSYSRPSRRVVDWSDRLSRFYHWHNHYHWIRCGLLDVDGIRVNDKIVPKVFVANDSRVTFSGEEVGTRCGRLTGSSWNGIARQNLAVVSLKSHDGSTDI